jgi:hypothetical protein
MNNCWENFASQFLKHMNIDWSLLAYCAHQFCRILLVNFSDFRSINSITYGFPSHTAPEYFWDVAI